MKRTLALSGVAAGLLASALVAQPASAAGDVASDSLAKTSLAAKNVVAYWFANRYANLVGSTPYNAETTIKVNKHVSTGGPSADGKAGTVPAIGDEAKSGGSSKNVNLPRTTGKVFFRGGDGKPHWCTATSLQSKYKNLVATAGSCVYDTVTNKATLDYWVFVPGYYQGKTPWGIYVGKTAYTHYDFDVYEDGDRNYAFVTVYNGLKAPASGLPAKGSDFVKWMRSENTKEVSKAEWETYSKAIRSPGPIKGKYYVIRFTDAGRLGDNVGGQGLAYNQKVGQNVYVFGYPSGSHPDGNHAYTGHTLKWSYGKTFKAKASAVKAEELIGVKSSFTGQGSLGSAWLSQYKSSRRLGYLNGLTSGVSDTDGNKRIDTSVSAYFDGETYGVYKAAANVWSGAIA
ncbi:hypothetical protein GT755_37965 [Herbidospora sp. NEAU-GS84]|uniref:Uncharacterized protein n=1 Tax=Herbidospora solisilvae TaxID=2696284 RepID=A0A7C9JIE8_9ACTN|nr:hypothetical protein [Herbidospora solisilvae]NAS27441.1 hypothetical protein [Herbidospora solisilvae]